MFYKFKKCTFIDFKNCSKDFGVLFYSKVNLGTLYIQFHVLYTLSLSVFSCKSSLGLKTEALAAIVQLLLSTVVDFSLIFTTGVLSLLAVIYMQVPTLVLWC